METITNSKIYELALAEKQHQETRRDEINKSYTSLFTAVLALAPIIDKFITAPANEKAYVTQIISIPLSVIGVLVSISWARTLKSIYNYIKSYEKFLIEVEKDLSPKFLTYVFNYLNKIDSSISVTKQEMWLPYTFGIAFFINLVRGIYFEVIQYIS
jgi:hypothetical protein